MQPQAREKAEKEGFEISVAKTSFKANTKALAENEGEGFAKVNFPYLFFFLWICVVILLSFAENLNPCFCYLTLAKVFDCVSQTYSNINLVFSATSFAPNA